LHRRLQQAKRGADECCEHAIDRQIVQSHDRAEEQALELHEGRSAGLNDHERHRLPAQAPGRRLTAAREIMMPEEPPNGRRGDDADGGDTRADRPRGGEAGRESNERDGSQGAVEELHHPDRHAKVLLALEVSAGRLCNTQGERDHRHARYERSREVIHESGDGRCAQRRQRAGAQRRSAPAGIEPDAATGGDLIESERRNQTGNGDDAEDQ
jgi:hypothetical protein